MIFFIAVGVERFTAVTLTRNANARVLRHMKSRTQKSTMRTLTLVCSWSLRRWHGLTEPTAWRRLTTSQKLQGWVQARA